MPWHLTKQYFDLQAEDGTVFIGYRALGGPRPLKLAYGASLLKKPGQRTIIRQKMTVGRLLEGNGGPRWEHKGLEFSACWSAGPAGAAIQYEGSAGSIDWQVGSLGGPAEVQFNDGRVLLGHGYWETVEMTILPWRLPFPELKWGRFIADQGAAGLVWVAWLGGEVTECRVWSEGGPLPAPEFEANGLNFQVGRLEFLDQAELRRGYLFKTLCCPLAGLARLLPGGLGRAFEAKWFSRARLTDRAGRVTMGWAVHETVLWR